jgi:hypothetical protein
MANNRNKLLVFYRSKIRWMSKVLHASEVYWPELPEWARATFSCLQKSIDKTCPHKFKERRAQEQREFDFWLNINQRPGQGPHGSCWSWRGRHERGYGVTPYVVQKTKASTQMVHRVLWEYRNGPLGKLDLHHVCRNKSCCNPEHLQKMTRLEHMSLHVPKGVQVGRQGRAKK